MNEKKSIWVTLFKHWYRAHGYVENEHLGVIKSRLDTWHFELGLVYKLPCRCSVSVCDYWNNSGTLEEMVSFYYFPDLFQNSKLEKNES